MNLRPILLSVLVGAVAVTGVWARQASPAQLALQAAQDVEIVNRDLKNAIARYRAVVSAYPKDRVVAPEALLRLAGCLEQLGSQPEALIAYERVVKEYPGTMAAKDAQKKLAAFPKEGSGFTATQMDGDNSGAPSLDGGYMSFMDWDTGDLAVRDLKSGRTRRVTETPRGTAMAEGSVPSPDGKQIAYEWSASVTELRVISSKGGAPTVLCCPNRSSEIRPFGEIEPFGWSMDGKEILFALVYRTPTLITTQIATVAASGGAPRVLKTIEGPPLRGPLGEPYLGSVGRASWSPDKRFIAYDAPRTVDGPEHAVFIMRSDGSNSAELTRQPANHQILDWFPDGKHILFVSDRNGGSAVFAQRIADGKAMGSAFLVLDNPAGRSLYGQGFTRDGSYYYGTQTTIQDVMTFRLDDSGAVSQVATRLPGRFANGKRGPAWSPDGSQIAHVQAGFGTAARLALAIQSVATGEARLVAVDLAGLANPAWMPDGRALIVEGTTAHGGQGLFRIDLGDGTLNPIGETTSATTGRRTRPVVSLDGREVLYTLDSKIIQARNLSSGVVRSVFEGSALYFALSPDGRSIAVSQRGQPILIVPVAGGTPRELSAETRNFGPGIAWSADGRYVWYTNYSPPGMPLWRVPIDGGPAEHMAALSNGMPIIGRLSAAPDGSMAVSVTMVSNEQWVMRNIPIPAGR